MTEQVYTSSGFSGRGPTATYRLNETDFYIVKYGKHTGVWSCDIADNKRIAIYSNNRGFLYSSLVIKF